MRCPSCLLRRPDLVLGLAFLLFTQALPAQVSQNSIMGTVHIQRGNFPAAPVMISLLTRGALVNSIYTDNEGRFGFNLLAPNVYHVVIDEKDYLKVEETVIIEARSGVRILSLTLIPREAAKDAPASVISGGNPNLTDPSQYARKIPKAARQEFEKGVKSDQQGKPEDAMRHYNKAIELAPDFYAVRNNLGSALVAKSQFPQAQEQFEKVIQINASDAAAYFNLANLYLLKSDYQKANNWVDQGLRREPNSGFGNFLRGSLFARTGKHNEAEVALRRCLELDPLMSKAHLALVNLYLQQNRTNDAASELREFLVRFPEDPFAPRAQQVLDRLAQNKPNR